MVKNKKTLTALLLFCVWLYGAWTLGETLLFPLMKNALQNEYLYALLRDGLIKNLIWTVPALALIRSFSTEMYVGFKQLYAFRREHIKYLLIAVLMAVFVITGSVVRRHGLSLNPSFHPAQLIVVLFVGFSEETVFRGFLLNAAMKNADSDVKIAAAVGVNALLFLVIHFPIWISSGTFITSFSSMAFVSILLLSAVFSWCFIRCKSLTVAIILHSVYDLLVFLLAG